MQREANMAYGYIVGREDESLGYFERRLRTASDPQERQDLEGVVNNLKRAVEARGTAAPPVERTWSQSLCCQGGVGR